MTLFHDEPRFCTNTVVAVILFSIRGKVEILGPFFQNLPTCAIWHDKGEFS